MNRKKYIKLLILSLILLGSFSTIKAENDTIQYSEHHLINKIFENHRYCVASFEENKIFIRPENIISTNQGLFINLNGEEFYKLPLIQFNKKGHFIEGIRFVFPVAKKEQTKGPCPNCGIDTDGKGFCRNDECFLCGFKVL